MAMITMIKKRDGRQVPFNIEKIANAIFKAAARTTAKLWSLRTRCASSSQKRL